MYQLISYLYYNHSISFLSCCWILVEANFSWVVLSWSRIRVRVRESGSSDRFYFLRLQNHRVLKSRDITWPTKVRIVKAKAFPVVMCRCESWIIKKAEPKNRCFWIVVLEKIGEGNGNPLQYSCLENPMGRGAWWAAVHGVLKSQDTTERLHFHFSLSWAGEGNGNPLQCSCLENPRDSGAWWAAIYGVAQSWTRLKWLSSSSGRRLKLLDCKKIKPVNPKRNQPWIFSGRTDAEAPVLWLPAKSRLIRKDSDAGKGWRQKEKGAAGDEMVR